MVKFMFHSFASLVRLVFRLFYCKKGKIKKHRSIRHCPYSIKDKYSKFKLSTIRKQKTFINPKKNCDSKYLQECDTYTCNKKLIKQIWIIRHKNNFYIHICFKYSNLIIIPNFNTKSNINVCLQHFNSRINKNHKEKHMQPISSSVRYTSYL